MYLSEHHRWTDAELTEAGLVEALRQAMIRTAAAENIDGAGCLLLDADCTLRYVTASNTTAEALEVAEELCVEGPCHEAFAGEDVRYADVQGRTRWNRLSTLLAASPIRTVIGVPILFGGQSIGALDVYSGQPQGWDHADWDGLHAAASAIGTLIGQALDLHLDQRGDELTAQLRAAIANRPRVREAAELIMASTGADRATSLLRLRQLAASSDQPTIDIASQVLDHGVPSIVDLAAQAAAVRHTRHEMARLALTDPLTGLANRTLFLDRTAQALARAERSHTYPAVVYVDLDRFKTVNDSLGHEAGDEVLCEVARRLEAAVRNNDTVARLGGDEFAVLCDSPTRVEVVTGLAERIAAALVEPITVTAPVPGSAPGREHQVTVRASIGVSITEDGAPPKPADLLRDADMAMYDAKANGGDQLHVFDDDMRRSGHRRMQVELMLRSVLDGYSTGVAAAPEGQRRTLDGAPDGIRLVYQPIIDVRTGRIISVEALVRAYHPQLGPVEALEIIGAAEAGGMIEKLGVILLAEACAALAQWQQVTGRTELIVAVNISPLQLTDPTFVDTVAVILDEHGLTGDRLCLELTESLLLAAGGPAMMALEAIQALGVNLSLDDFGTGYSSLSYLSRLPVGQLKLDRTFVAGIDTDPHRAAVARAIVSLGQALGLETVAEGAETAEQAAHVAGLGCDLVQGFLFSRPVEAHAIPELLAAAPFLPA